MFNRREIVPFLKEAARTWPAIVLTGARRTGKTTVLRRTFPQAQYVLLEDPDVLLRVRSDPRGFLDGLRPPVLLDEIQNAPELFAWVRTRIDSRPGATGQWLFTGSQESALMQGVSESMAGRAAILQMMPFSLAENGRVSPLCGGYPEVVARLRQGAAARRLWFDSYIQTYLERDVRAVTNVRDLPTFRRFLALVASRHGQMLNRTDIAAPLGVSVPTVGEWLRVLELTGQIVLAPPWYENLGKRIVKSPKIYIADSGLACHLLGITSQAELARSPWLGAIFEGFVAAEILKSQVNRGGRKELYHFRDQQGLEVDFLFPAPKGEIWMVECKASKTVVPPMASPLRKLSPALETSGAVPRKVRRTVVHMRADSGPGIRSLAPGIEALDLEDFVAELNRAEGRKKKADRNAGAASSGLR